MKIKDIEFTAIYRFQDGSLIAIRRSVSGRWISLVMDIKLLLWDCSGQSFTPMF
jgi:hypothetical protein